MKERQVIVDGLHINYAEAGEGPVVLFLHGWGNTHASFLPLLRELGVKNYRVVLLDFPGFGKSQLPKNAWSVSDYAQLTTAFLQKINVESVEIIVGHSLGGRIMIKGVGGGIITPPKKLVFLAAAGMAHSGTLQNKALVVVSKIGKIIFSIWPLSLAYNWLRTAVHHTIGSTDYLTAGSMQTTLQKVISESLVSEAEKIEVPSLLIWGADDRVTPTSEGEILHHALQSSEFVIIPAAGHYPHHDAVTKVAARIKLFLS